MCASRHVLDEIGNTNAQLDRTELVAVFPPVLVFEHPSLNVHDKAFERCELRSLKTYNVVVAKSAIQSQRVYAGKRHSVLSIYDVSMLTRKAVSQVRSVANRIY